MKGSLNPVPVWVQEVRICVHLDGFLKPTAPYRDRVCVYIYISHTNTFTCLHISYIHAYIFTLIGSVRVYIDVCIN